MTRSRSPTAAQRVVLVLFGVATAGAGLLLVEGGLALFGVAEEARYEDPYLGFAPGATLFEATTGANGERVYATRPSQLEFFNHQSFDAAKEPGALRVFALGGSTTYGHPYDDDTSFARWLERFLDAAEPGRKHEVVNAGGISYASYRIVLLMRELVRYSPDLFVIYTGHNEFLEERTYRELLAQPEAIRRLGYWLQRYRLTAVLRRAGRRFAPAAEPAELLPAEVKTRLDVWTGLDAYHRDDALARSIVEQLGVNLERMIRIARDAGAAVVLVEPVSNLKDFSPFKSEHRAGLTAGDRAEVEALLERGRQRLDAGEVESALADLEGARALDPDFAETHFRIGRALFARGAFDQAEPAFVRAKDLDVAPLRSLESELATIRRTAQDLDVPLIDLPALLAEDCRRRFGHAILGDEYLLDHVHPDIATHSLIAEQVLEVLADAGAAKIDPVWSESRRLEIYDSVVRTIDQTYHARRDLNLGKVLGWAGKLAEAEPPLRRAASVLDGDPDLHLTLGTLLSNTGRFEEAAGELRRAVELDPGVAAAHFNLGVAYGRLGRPEEGIAALEQALRLRPDYAEAMHNLGVLKREAGDVDGAIADLRRALELAPRVIEVQRSLAAAYRQAGRDAEAADLLRRALELDPDSAGVHLDLGVSLAREERLGEAAAELERAVALDPAAAEAHYNLGLVRARTGRIEEASASYERALELEPLHAGAHNNLGILLAQRGDLASARRHLERATELDPANAEAHLNLGVVYDQSGRAEAALAEVEQAATLQPANADVQLALALLYQSRGRTQDARAHYDRARAAGAAVAPEVAARFER